MCKLLLSSTNSCLLRPRAVRYWETLSEGGRVPRKNLHLGWAGGCSRTSMSRRSTKTFFFVKICTLLNFIEVYSCADHHSRIFIMGCRLLIFSLGVKKIL